MNVLSLISNQINNLFSDVLHTKKIGFVEKIRFKRFQVKVDLTLRKMINKSDCTILTSDLFERFMKYHHPFEKMILNISGKGDSILSKERFIEKQIDLFLNTNDISNENPIDKIIMMDLFTKIYVLIENYYIKDLSKNEKYVIGVIEKVKDNISTEIVENAHKVIDVVKNESDEIKKMVSRLGVIDDSDLLCSIYFAFSKEILNGRASEVYSLYPLLNGKSNDLELGIAYLFKIFSNRIVDDVDFSTIQERIRNEQIYSDLAQKTIYYSLLEKDDELLNSINDRNLDIYDIKCHLQAKNYNVFFTTQTEQKDGMFYVEYKLTDNFPEYKWIVRKICMFSILEQHLVNSVQFIESMLSENYFVIDQVLLAEKRVQELGLVSDIDLNKANEVLKQIEILKNSIENIPLDMQKKYYCAYIRLGLYISNEKAKAIIQTIPTNLKKDCEIEMLCVQAEMDSENVSVQKILELCIKTEKYWLFRNYLAMIASKNPNDAKKQIEMHLFTIDIDPAIFLIYAQLIATIDGIEKSVGLFEKSEDKFGQYLEFWIDKLRMRYNETEMTNVVNRWLKKDLLHLSYDSDLEFLKLLMNHNRYKDVLHCALLIEKKGNVSVDFLRIKANALLNTKHEIDALTIYKKLFNDNVRDNEVVYNILAISINNKRKIDSNVIESAKKIENTSTMELLSICEELEGHFELANEFILKALLRTNDENSSVYGRYLGMHVKKENEKSEKITCVTEDTATHCMDEQGNEKIICIHSKKVLPDEFCNWENAEHIYKEKAIHMGLLRKKIDDLIEIYNVGYKIKQIEPLDVFLFRVCTNHLVNKGDAKIITTVEDETGKMDIESLEEQLREILGDDSTRLEWLDQYKNMSEMPLPIFLYTPFARITYTQLIDAFVEDISIPYRETYGNVKKSNKYVLTTAALVILNKIGYEPNKNKEIVISTSLEKVVFSDTEQVINDNNRKIVASMGIEKKHLYCLETSDESKQAYMSKAVKLKDYTSNFEVKENVVDLTWQDDRLDIKEFMGIADYDAMCLAQKDSYTLVTAEVAYTSFSNLLDINVNTICIADFLNDVCSDIEQLLRYIEILMSYRFVIPFTDAVVLRLAKVYDECNDLEKKILYARWQHILSIPLQDKNYMKIMTGVGKDILNQTKEYFPKGHPVWSALLYSEIKYMGNSLRISIEEENLVTQIVKDEENVEIDD